jgi:HEAT repeat protein
VNKDLQNIIKMSEEERLKLAEGIGDLSFKDNKELFKVLLGDESFRVRKMALESLLKKQQPDELTDLFIEVIDSQDNAGLRTAGVEGLTRIGKNAVKKILKAIDPEQWELTKLLVDVLGDIGDPQVVPVLIKLTSNTQQNLATSAIEALGKIGTPDVISHLIELLKEKEIYIVFSALEALASLGKKGFALPADKIVPLIKDNPLLKKAVFDLLGSTHDAGVVKYLIEGIKDNKRSNRDAAAKALLQLYNSVGEMDRGHIKESIKGSGIYDSYIIEKMLSSVDNEVVITGIRILGWYGGRGKLATILKYADNPDIIDACVLALTDIGESIRFDIVGLLVGNKSIPQIRAGLMYLSKLPDYAGPPPEGLSYLLDITDPQDIPVLLASAISTFIDVQSLKLLTRLMSSDDKLISASAIDNFIKVGKLIPDHAIDIIHGLAHKDDYLLRLASAKLISSFYKDNFRDDIKTLLNDSEPVVRASMIATVGVLKLTDYIEDVQIGLTDENRDVRIEAVRAVASLVPDRFLDIIKWLINDEDQWVRIEIIKHLKDSGQLEEAKHILKSYLNDESPAVLLTAIQVLIDAYLEDSTDEINKILAKRDEDIVHETMYMLAKTRTRKAYDILKGLSLSEDKHIREQSLSVLERYYQRKDI